MNRQSPRNIIGKTQVATMQAYKSPEATAQPRPTFFTIAGALALLCFVVNSQAADKSTIDDASGHNNVAVTGKPVIALDEDADLSKKLLNAYQALGSDYRPRTEHLFEDGTPHYINRLISEDSPYLLQHAHNPVNWYPWGEESMFKAWSEDKPVFLSIGYATCHWCHVMERESFENEEIADFLNKHFITVKVDREQRPDVDSTYMTAVQMMTGGGGWPMSSFLNTKATPFYGGTYYPPEAFLDLLKQIVKVWDGNRNELENQALKVGEALTEINTVKSAARAVGERDIQSALAILLSDFDDFQGGFGGAPKFPREPALYLLLEQAQRTGNNELLQAAHFTLERIAAGGIHDQAGGGFHRYSVDQNWLVPHFEKMLYNQAALSRNYLQSWLLTGDVEHKRVARRTLDYVLREMTAPEGGFYSATDADSDGGEGRFFIWTDEELRTVLGQKDAELAGKIWNTSTAGNFEHANILHLSGPLRHLALELDMPIDELTTRIDTMSEKLLVARQARELPQLDDKIISAWNGMMITALAQAGDAMDNQRYITAAEKAANFVMRENVKTPATAEPGQLTLWRTHYNGTSSVDAGQSDYAFLAEAMIALFDVTGSKVWLEHAEQLVASMDLQFWDNEDGAYFMGKLNSGGAELPVRPKERYDNATPTGNSVALRVLARLAARTGNEAYRERAEKLLAAFSGIIDTNPSAFGYLLTGTSELQFGESGHRQFAARGHVAITGAAQVDSGAEFVKLHVEIAKGWHINAHQPLQDYLIGTSVQTSTGQAIDGIDYPVAKRATLGFERSELALYESSIEIDVPVSKLPAVASTDSFDPSSFDSKPVITSRAISINIQACNDTVCLAPETVTLNVSPHAIQ